MCIKCGCFFNPIENVALRTNELSSNLMILSYNIYYPNSESERSDAIKQISSYLKEAENLHKDNEINNFDKIKDDVILLNKLKHTLNCLQKSDAKLIANDLKGEVKLLLEALNSLINLNIKIKKFDSFNFKSETRKRCWTVSYIKQRLIEDGYKPNRNN